jgi:hydrogenase/urease accessory protein HupE
MSLRKAAALGAAFVVLHPATGMAHLSSTGLGPVYDGIAHLFLSVDDLLPVVAMALLAGLNGARASRLALFLLPSAWLAGGVAGYAYGAPLLPAVVTAASFLVLGTLTAVDRRLPDRIVVGLALLLGGLHGWLNGADIAGAAREPTGLLGIGASVFVVVALTAAVVVSLRAAWARVAVRVAGSWVAAVGVLLLGWGLRPGR